MPTHAEGVASTPVFAPDPTIKSVRPQLRTPAASAFSTAARHTLQGSPILVVDDDPSIRTMVSDLLTTEGYAVCTASNGADALDVLERTSPRLVLLDMRMPVLDGWGFARELKQRHDWVPVPVLIMTAAIDASRWAADIDAAGYVSKPFEVATLLDNVERLLLPD